MMQISKIENLLRDRKYQRILGAYEYNLREIFIGGQVASNKKVIVFNHNTPWSRTLSEDYGDQILIHHNHYAASFLDNLAFASLCKSAGVDCCLSGKRNLSEIYAYFARKFVAEQMLEIADSRMGRVLFLECLIEFEDDIRSILTVRSAEPRLARSSDLFTSMVSDFLLHHELGHSIAQGAKFSPFLGEARNYIDSTLRATDKTSPGDDQFEEEVASDIFGLAVILKMYAEVASEATLRDYARHLVHTIVRMETLYDTAADLHRRNVDKDFPDPEIELVFSRLARRLQIMEEYLAGVEFSKETVLPLETDDFVAIASGDEVTSLSEDPTRPISARARRLAESISIGFEPGKSFPHVVEAYRTTRTVRRPLEKQDDPEIHHPLIDFPEDEDTTSSDADHSAPKEDGQRRDSERRIGHRRATDSASEPAVVIYRHGQFSSRTVSELEVLAEGFSDTHAVAARLAITRQAVNDAIKRQRLFGIRRGNAWQLPNFQFQGTRILPGLTPILRAGTGLDDWTVLHLIVDPDEPPGRRPLALLREGHPDLALSAFIAASPAPEQSDLGAALDEDLRQELEAPRPGRPPQPRSSNG